MKNALNSVKIMKPTTNAFNLSHNNSLTLNMGLLIPILAMPVLPGDRVRIGGECLSRLAPMIAPMMSRVNVRIEYFFVPNRLLWEEWETFITNGGDQPTQQNPLPAHPYAQYSDHAETGVQSYSTTPLLDYLHLPDPEQCEVSNLIERFDPMACAAYQKIADDYFRDQNLMASPFPDGYILDDGLNANPELFKLRRRCWESDLFTRALPFAQKGVPVDVPLGEVQLKDTTTPGGADGNARFMRYDQSGAQSGAVSNATVISGNPSITAATDPTVPLVYDPAGTLQVGATTIDDLNLAYKLQMFLQLNARGGTRYSELIRAHFNEFPEDSRLQRAEYIVGLKDPIKISEVLNTTGTTEQPQGDMAGHGVQFAQGNFGKYHAREHGYIIGLMSFMPETIYFQGIPNHMLPKTDPTEYPFPVFGNLGEQPIQNREVMAFRASNAGDLTFGYTPRYMPWKTIPNRIAGQFKTTLKFWTMAREFDPITPPQLNSDFVESDPTMRIFAVQDEGEDPCWCTVENHIMVIRALPFYGTPSLTSAS